MNEQHRRAQEKDFGAYIDGQGVGHPGREAVFSRSANTQRTTKIFYLTAIALGGIFVIAQGAEWLRLLRFSLTLTSGLYGSFFYLIVGMHSLHAVAGLIALASVFPLLSRKESARSGAVKAVGLYWLFVVGLWPVLYGLVYLLMTLLMTLMPFAMLGMGLWLWGKANKNITANAEPGHEPG